MLNISNTLCVFSAISIILLGIYLSVKSGFFQFKCLPKALKNIAIGLFKKQNKSEGLTSRQAMCTALAATIGTGNIVGISGAIALSGPGIIFWVWVSSALAMIIKYCEINIAMRYRIKCNGSFSGGTMYAVKYGLKKSFLPLAYIFALCGITASFGTGNLIQIRSVTESVSELSECIGIYFEEIGLITAVILAVFIGFLLLSGAKAVGKVCESLVPLMLLLYVLASFGVIVMNYRELPLAFKQIIIGAFSPQSITGGAVCSVFIVIKTGMMRGIVSNEAGLGTATVAHTAADTNDFISEGMLGIAEVFIDSFTCTLTAIVVLLGNRNPVFGTDSGQLLILNGFANVYGTSAKTLLALFLILFGISSVLGWGAYGISFCRFLFGNKGEIIYKLIFSAVCVLSAVISSENIWIISEILNSVMSIPNIIVLFLLSDKVEYR